MNTTTSILTATAVIAFCVGGGIYLGHSNATGEVEKKKSAGASAASKIGGTNGNSWKGPGSTDTGRRTALFAEDSGDMDLKMLIGQAASHFRKGEEDSSANEKGRALLAKLKFADVREAMKLAAGHQSDELVYRELLEGIMKIWAAEDPKGAIDFALANVNKSAVFFALRVAFQEWSTRDPGAAIARLNSLGGEKKISYDHDSGIRRSIMREWTAVDPKEALAQLSALPYDQQKHLLNSMDSVIANPEKRQAYLDALVEMEKGDVRVKLIEDAAESYADIDPEGAMEWFDKLEFANERMGFKAAAEMAESLFEKNPQQAVNWLWRKTPEDFKVRFISEYVGESWMRRDPEAASAWLREQGYDPDALPEEER